MVVCVVYACYFHVFTLVVCGMHKIVYIQCGCMYMYNECGM